MAGTDILQWTGAAQDGAWTNAANWSIYAGTPAGTTPSIGEGVHFGRLAAWPLTSYAIVALNNWFTTRECEVSIGGPGNPVAGITIDSGTTPEMNCAGRGQFFFFNGTQTKTVIDTPSAVVMSGGTLGEVVALMGDLTLSAASVLSTVTNNGARLTIEDTNAADFIETLTHNSGTTTTKRSADIVDMGGDASSILSFVDAAAIDQGSSKVTQHGGQMKWLSSGNIDEHVGLRGLFDPRGNPNTTFTVSSRTTYNSTFDFLTSWESGSIVDSDPTDYGAPKVFGAPVGGPSGIA